MGSWLPKGFPHRNVRREYTGLNRIESYFPIISKDLFSYREYASYYLDTVVLFLQNQFGEDYRRQGDSIEIAIVDNFTCDINMFIDRNTIDFDLGLLFAVEDLNHSLCADINFALAETIATSSDEVYANECEFEDEINAHRHLNYDVMINHLQGKRFPDEDYYVMALFKCIADDQHRQMLADLMTDVSICFLVAHENAHEYRGHLDFFKDYFVTRKQKGHRFYSEIERPNDDPFYTAVRRAAESEADSDAIKKTLDYYLDDELFSNYEFFQKSVTYYHYISEDKVDVLDYEPIAIMELVITSIIAPLLVFHKNEIIENHATANYQSFVNRISNVILTVISKARANTVNHAHLYLAPVNDSLLMMMLIRVRAGIILMLKQLCQEKGAFSAEAIIGNKKLQVLTDIDYFRDLLAFSNLIENNFDFITGKLDDLALHYPEVIRSLIEERIEHLSISRENLFNYRLQKNLHIKEKLEQELEASTIRSILFKRLL